MGDRKKNVFTSIPCRKDTKKLVTVFIFIEGTLSEGDRIRRLNFEASGFFNPLPLLTIQTNTC